MSPCRRPTGIAYGSQKAIEALRANPANTGAKVEWTPAARRPVRRRPHGFTAGFMTVHARGRHGAAARSTWRTGKSRRAGWRVLAYKRAPAKAAAPRDARRLCAAEADRCRDRRCRGDRAAIARASRTRSDRSRVMRRRWASARRSRSTAAPRRSIFGGPDVPTLRVRATKRSATGWRGAPPNTQPRNWGPEKTIIAASGDFGVTIGYIVRNAPGRRWQDSARPAVLHDLAARQADGIRGVTSPSELARLVGAAATRAREDIFDGRVVLRAAQRVAVLHRSPVVSIDQLSVPSGSSVQGCFTDTVCPLIVPPRFEDEAVAVPVGAPRARAHRSAGRLRRRSR